MAQQARAANKAIRHNYRTLTTAVTQGEIPAALYEKEIIDDDTLEIASKQALTDRDKGKNIMSDVQKAVKSNPELFFVFCEVLAEESSNLKELSDKLEENYTQYLNDENTTIKKTMTLAHDPEKGELTKLKDELETYKNLLARPCASGAALVCIKESLQHYIETTLKAGSVEPEALQEEMYSLCHHDRLVPSSEHTWVLDQVQEISQRLLATAPTPESPSQLDPVAEPPLFCKDTVYHASLCCHVSSSCTAQNFKSFLNRQLPGHMLEEVSMSIPHETENVGRFLIAKKENTIYVAFQGNPPPSLWLKKHASFNDGLKKQMNQVPLRFLVEQLQDRNRIVLTGFSFGGMLACCVAANIWEMSYISTEVLKKDVVCITFGQPLVKLPFVQNVMRKFPKFETTIHSVFDREDVVPRLFYYFRARVGCVYYSPNTKRAKQSMKRPFSAPTQNRSRSRMSSQEPFGSFLQNLAVLQEECTSGVVSSQHSKTEALNMVKSDLRKLIPITNPDASVVCGTSYTISCEEGSGLTWNAVLPKKTDPQEFCLDADTIEKLKTTLYKQHNMDGYRHKLFRSYLEKQPDVYSGPLPAQAVKEVKEVSLLIPEVKAIEFHSYPNEYAVVIEGDKLWFCHKIHISNNKGNIHKIDTPVQNITRRSIQFNFTPSEGEKSMPDNGHMEITLYSHFAQPIKEMIPVKQEPYSFSLRQIQLAKQTPSEIIQLAFWSAVFEWHPKHASHHTPSQRFQEVTRFIEEAAKVVPFESIFYAVAYSDNDIAFECSKAIKAYISNRKNIPPSEMMVEGSYRAAARMRTGIRTPSNFDEKAAAGIAMRQGLIASPDVKHYFQPACTSGSTASEASSKLTQSRHIRAASYGDSVTHDAATTTMVQQQTIVLPPIIVPIPVVLHENGTPPPPPSDVADCLHELAQNIESAAQAATKMGRLDVVCNLSIEEVYPSRRQSLYDRTLKSPVKVLKSARETLASFIQKVQSNEAQSIDASNEELVELLKDIQDNKLQICAALLGAFMEQQIRIPLLKSPADTASILASKTAPVAVGVWALFSLSYGDLQEMLSQVQGNALLVEIADYISGIFQHDEEQKPSKTSDRKYAGKLQFLLQGIKKTVSCSSQYIGYSLEHQLCNNPRFDKSTPLEKLIDDWETIFKGDALSLVAKSHRPLIARWLKWAVLVHDLREALAKYTCVGVVGLVNSGKSQLVNTLFKAQALVGTTEHKRTVVPLMYNLDGSVDGLDVIDFPGVDDRDHSIPGLAKMLITLSQVVVFVVDYRKIHSDPAREWLQELEAEEDVPLLVCLTHADRLYAELMGTEGNPEPTDSKKQKIHEELERIKQRLDIGCHPSRSVAFYCFHQEPDSTIKTESLREVNIFGPEDVGKWLVSTFKHTLDQKELAENLEKFIYGRDCRTRVF